MLRAVGSDTTSSAGPTEPAPEQPQTQQDDWLTYANFYAIYPRHEGRKDGERAWNALPKYKKVACLIAVANWRPIWDDRAAQRADFLEYFPLPATWIRGERFEDEIPARAYANITHVPAQLPPEEFVKGEIPPHVKAMLDKMRSKR